MSSITIIRPLNSGGISYDKDDVVTDLDFAIAGLLVRSGEAFWTGSPNAQPLPDTKNEAFLGDVTEATGGTAAALDGYTTSHLPTGRVFAVVIDGKRCVYQLQAAGVLVADGDGIVQPPDFDATSNNRLLVQIQ